VTPDRRGNDHGPECQLRLRVVLHAGDVHDDPNSCFGNALDLPFRLLDAISLVVPDIRSGSVVAVQVLLGNG